MAATGGTASSALPGIRDNIQVVRVRCQSIGD